MANESTQALEGEVTKTEEESKTVTISPEEEKARAGGWKPLEEWEGNPDDWADYKEFNKRGEYIDHIKSLSSDYKRAQKKLARLEESFNQLAEHHSKVREIEYEKALKDLQNLKKEALSNMDYDRVVEVDEKISELKETDPKKQPQVQPSQDVPEELQEWIAENSWYDNDAVLRGATNALIEEIVKRDPSRKNDISGVLSEVTMKMKKEFPNKFGAPRTRKSEIVDVGDEPTTTQRGSAGTPKNLARHLNEEQRRIAHRFVKQGAVKSIEEYAQQLYEIGEIKSRGA